jgi:serine/threonine protein kinase
MKTVRVVCPKCGANLKTNQSIPVGKRLKCPKCANPIVALEREEPADFGTLGAPGAGNGEQPVAPEMPPAQPPAFPQVNPPAVPQDSPPIPGYVILGELGRGGMGVVYKARQVSLGRVVALKMILTGGFATEDSVARFRSEAAALARLQHPNIVQVYEVGEYQGLPFFSLEYINGPTLAKRLSGTPQPARPSAELMETLAAAVHAAHQRGIIHRDLKPGNVLLATMDGRAPSATESQQLYGVAKITDFGLAKRLDGDAAHTRTGSILGTPCYMAPEQATGQPVGPGADIYALGSIFYEMLTGRPPFKAATAADTLLQLISEDVVPLSRLQPYIPRDLQTICMKCLNKEPHRRYANALALAEDLRRYLHGEPIQARSLGAAERLFRWCVRYPLPTSLLAAVSLCLIFSFWYLTRLSDQLVRSAALESAAQQSDMLSEVNTSYADVVARAKRGNLEVTHTYAASRAAIPIPATFTIELGQQISDRSEDGLQIRMYSDYPFRSRRNGGPKDDFEKEALARLRQTPGEPVYRFEDYKGRPSLRYATARLMEQTCVDCHNAHPDSPKKDWHVGEVRGVVEIIHPLDKDFARTSAGLHGAFILIGTIGASLLGLAGLGILYGNFRRSRHSSSSTSA